MKRDLRQHNDAIPAPLIEAGVTLRLIPWAKPPKRHLRRPTGAGRVWLKLEIHPDARWLLPGPIETPCRRGAGEAGFCGAALLRRGSGVARLEEVGAAVMPLGVIGSKSGWKTAGAGNWLSSRRPCWWWLMRALARAPAAPSPGMCLRCWLTPRLPWRRSGDDGNRFPPGGSSRITGASGSSAG